MKEPFRVIKVGGSLYDLPDLAVRLRAWFGREPTLLVPGGGGMVEAIRSLDRVHRFVDQVAHDLAIRALALGAEVLAEILGSDHIVDRVPEPDGPYPVYVLRPTRFCREDQELPGSLPQCWNVTSDSIAARVALRARARELILMKSVSWPATDEWEGAARAGVVDDYFPEAVRQDPLLRVRVVNLREGVPGPG
jgi:aspartokinase-like uncharacterized kinase